jgi:hypothetical protein
VQFIDDPPEVTDTLFGFGKVKLTVSQSPSKGLTLNPHISFQLRLLREEVLEQLPELSMNSDLKTITKTPSALGGWNPSRAEKCTTSLPDVTDSLLNDIGNWHTQSMRVLPSKKAFESHTFSRLSETAIEKVRNVVPQLEKELQALNAEVNRLSSDPATQVQVGKMEQLRIARIKQQQASETLRSARQNYLPVVGPFTVAMRELSKGMQSTNIKLLKHHDAVSEWMTTYMASVDEVNIRCSLAAGISIDGCENGAKIDIYFLESASQNWPVDAVLPEAK